MIKANELRIGNYALKSLKSGNGRKIEVKVDIHDFIRICDGSKIYNFKPIPLTEEWLVKFGFYNSERLKNSFIKNGVHIYIQDTAFWYDLANDSIEVKTIHQLQNLYFALTGTELKINTL